MILRCRIAARADNLRIRGEREFIWDQMFVLIDSRRHQPRQIKLHH